MHLHLLEAGTVKLQASYLSIVLTPLPLRLFWPPLMIHTYCILESADATVFNFILYLELRGLTIGTSWWRNLLQKF